MTIALARVSLRYTISNGPGDPRDWVGLFRKSAANNAYVSFVYLANNRNSPRPTVGVKAGTVDLEMLNPTSDIYEIRLMTATGTSTYTVLEYSNPFVVNAVPLGLLKPPTGTTINPDGSWTIPIPDGQETVILNL